MPKSWVAEVMTEGEWVPNGLRFASEDEAARWGSALLARWTTPTAHRAVESKDAVNYRLDGDGALHPVEDDE